MATGQQLFVDRYVNSINTNPNLAPYVIASSPHAGILRVTTKTTDAPRVYYQGPGSTVTGTGTFADKAATGNPPYAELWFSWTLAPGDTVKVHVQVGARQLDLTENIPVGTAVDAGGFDHTSYNPNGGTGGGAGGVSVGGTGVGSARHRRLVVMECGSASTSFGSMFALDPQDATGVAIPTFRVVQSLPAAGSSAGESVYVTATRQGYVWDGTGWRDITASPILTFANDTVLQADTTHAVGTYSVASDTGNIYVYTADGWRRIGIVEFNSYADMNAWDAAIGTQAISRDLDVLFLRVEDGAGTESWAPISQMVKTQAEILAVQNIAGLTAVASDNGKRFVNNGTRWVQDPIEHYATEADLLAATPIDGHLAWSDDTQVVFTAAGGAWHRLPGPQITVGNTEPTVNATGDMWYLRSGDERGLKIWDGTDADPANHGWRDADRNPILYIGSGAFNNTKVNKAGNWGMPANTVPNPQNYMPQTDDQYLDVATGLYVRLTGPAVDPGTGRADPAVDPGITSSVTIGDVTPQTSPSVLNVFGQATNSTWQEIPKPAHSILLEGSGQTTSTADLLLIAQRNNAWVNWGNNLAQSHANVQYDDSGYRSLNLGTSGEWTQNAAGLWLTRNAGSYHIGAGKYFTYKIQLNFYPNGESVITAWVEYISDNDTPMWSVATYVYSAASAFGSNLTHVGLKASAGNIAVRFTLTHS